MSDENRDSDDACAASSLRCNTVLQSCVYPSLSNQNDEMHEAMAASVLSPRNFPRHGLVRNVGQGGSPFCLCTSVSRMPCKEAPRVQGDTPVLPRTIGEVLVRRDHANWCEALQVESGAMHAMKVC